MAFFLESSSSEDEEPLTGFSEPATCRGKRIRKLPAKLRDEDFETRVENERFLSSKLIMVWFMVPSCPFHVCCIYYP